MEFFKKTTKINFLGIQNWAYGLSILAVLLSVFFLFKNGLNWGLEFTGGTEIQLSFDQPADLEKIRQDMINAGFSDAVIQTYGPTTNALLRLSGKQQSKEKSIVAEVQKVLPNAKILSDSYIGPQVGEELAINGALALFVAMIGTAIYIAFRFEYKLALSAAIALLHDPIIILGVFAVMRMEFNLISLAAILTIIGYSLNDTIVVFDRIRENFRKYRTETPTEVVNLSVNQTLSRTTITSGLTLLAVLALFFFGGEVLHGFATAFVVGIVVGTYSSIYIAGALAIKLGLTRQDLMPTAKEAIDDRP